tara:strand:- start:1123 stop:1671 length:549 start_codon:yes stop_codon:yes gene_type:complete
MAVTEILGTDSLSSSRVTLNNNFLDLQDEIIDLKHLLSPQSNLLSGVDVVANTLIVNGGQTTLQNTTTDALDVNGNVDLKAAIMKSGVNNQAANPIAQLPTTLLHSTYFIDCTNPFILGPGSEGQEITLIVSTINNTTLQVIDSTSVAGANSITPTTVGATLTLRFFDPDWYVIGSHKVTIT